MADVACIAGFVQSLQIEQCNIVHNPYTSRLDSMRKYGKTLTFCDIYIVRAGILKMDSKCNLYKTSV